MEEVPCPHIPGFFLDPVNWGAGCVSLERFFEEFFVEGIELLDAQDGDVVYFLTLTLL